MVKSWLFLMFLDVFWRNWTVLKFDRFKVDKYLRPDRHRLVFLCQVQIFFPKKQIICRCCIFSLGIPTCGSGPLRCMAVIFFFLKKISYQFRLVNAMHRNGPLTQVKGRKWGFPKKNIKGWCLSPMKLLLHPFSVYPHFVQNKYCTHTTY